MEELLALRLDQSPNTQHVVAELFSSLLKKKVCLLSLTIAFCSGMFVLEGKVMHVGLRV